MNIIKTDIEGVLIIEPRLFRDARGYFFESFSEREFEEKVATSIILRLMEVSASSMTLSVLIGSYQPNMPFSQRKIPSMIC